MLRCVLLRDAEDAIYDRDGYNYDGYTLRVEKPKGAGGGPRGSSRGYTSGRGLYGGRSSDYGRCSSGYTCGSGTGHGSRRSDYRVRVSGLPKSGSWQDLKDHMREAGDVCYTDVFRNGTGVVEFLRYDDMKYAVRKLDDTKFRSHEGETSYITVDEDYERRSYSRSRSRSYSPRGRESYSPRGRESYSPRGRERSSPSY